MNILFVNYGDLTSNSLTHIGPYANELVKSGFACTVSIDSHAATSEPNQTHRYYRVMTHQQILNNEMAFLDAQPAAIVHAWTPRENVRKVVQHYRALHNKSRLIIHIEDNEDAIIESFYQRPITELRKLAQSEDKSIKWIPNLCHPTNSIEFIQEAHGFSYLTEKQSYLLPRSFPRHRLVPILETPETNNERSELLRQKLKIGTDTNLVVFPGGVTTQNRQDVHFLYQAIAILNEKGYPTKLVKTGPNCHLLSQTLDSDLAPLIIDEGMISRRELFDYLNAADILIQPGVQNKFNEDRFPCKIPELLSSRAPCIIPSMYIASAGIPEEACLTLEDSSPGEIAEKCICLLNDPARARTLSQQATDYVNRTYKDPESKARNLAKFYYETKELSTDVHHSRGTISKESKIKILIERNEELKKQLENNRTDINRLEQKQTKIEQSLLITEQALAEERDRVERIRNSASWKLTYPLRYLRRNLIDKKEHPSKKTPGSDIHPVEQQNTLPSDHPHFWRRYNEFLEIETKRNKEYLTTFPLRLKRMSKQPKISILLPVYNIEEIWLRQCLESVLSQVYPNWELCIADDASTLPHIKRTIEDYQIKDERIRAIYRECNGHISTASNSAFSISTGEYIALLDHDDILPSQALAKVAEKICEFPTANIFYSDEDKIDINGVRHGPHFKSDWNYDLFLGCNMICHLGVYKRQAFKAAGGFRTGTEGAQDWDLALRISEISTPSQIVHIPEILYHWRNIDGSTAQDMESKPYALAAQKKVIEEHLSRCNRRAKLHSIKGIHWRIEFEIPSPPPLVSIIIPTKDRIDFLKPCIDSIRKKTNYKNYEITIVDNDSNQPETKNYLKNILEQDHAKVVPFAGSFNYSAICNWGVKKSSGEIIVLLNNDTEVISEEWLSELVSHCCRPEIGVVGAKLLFPHDHVQHCGVIMGIGGVAGHAFRFLHKDDDGHVHRAQLTSSYSAVTGACMAMKRSIWDKVQGLDQINLAESYNDVDICLRVLEEGYLNVVTPFALLYHKESGTRGYERDEDKQKLFDKEYEYMLKKWEKYILNDPYYNPNFNLDTEDFSYKLH